MSIFPIDLALAAKAFKLSTKGLKGKAISVALGNGVTTDDANLLAAVGSDAAHEERCRLTDRECSILLALADIQREDRLRGHTSSPKAKRVAWRLRLSEGQVGRVTRKRLNTPDYATVDREKLGFLHHSINGHIWLTDTGWAVVHALEKSAKATSLEGE